MHKPIVIAAIATSLLVAGCSSDGDGDAKTIATSAKTTATSAIPSTTAAAVYDKAARAAFCTKVKNTFGNYKPGFDAIFANGNDHPTLQEWADFLPAPTKELDDLIARLKAVETIEGDPEITAAFNTAIDKFDTMSQNFHDSIKAAAAGNQAEYDRLESENQGTNGPALQRATDAFGELCGFPRN